MIGSFPVENNKAVTLEKSQFSDLPGDKRELERLVENVFCTTRDVDLPEDRSLSLCRFILGRSFTDALRCINNQLGTSYKVNAYIVRDLLNTKMTDSEWHVAKNIYPLPGCRFLESIVINIFLFKASERKDYGTLKEIYNFALREGRADYSVYASYIFAVGEAREFSDAEEAFKRATQFKIDNPVGDVDFDCVQSAYNHSQILKITDAENYNSFIEQAGKEGDYQSAMLLFDYAIKMNIADVETYNKFINCALQAGDLKSAEKVFFSAVNKGIANIETHNRFIKVALLVGDYNSVEWAFHHAKLMGIANAETYKDFIKAAFKAGHLMLAVGVLDEIEENGMNDLALQMFIVNMYFRTNRMERARELFEKYRAPIGFSFFDEKYHLDLSNQYIGVGCLQLDKVIELNTEQTAIIVKVGSSDPENRMIQHIKQFHKNWTVVRSQNEEGVLFITYKVGGFRATAPAFPAS